MRGLQIGLFDLLLLVALAGVIIGYVSIDKRSQQMQEEIADMKIVAGELVVDDPTMLVAKKSKSDFADVVRQDFFIPQGAEYEVCFSQQVLANAPTVEKKIDLKAGMHWVDIRERHTVGGKPRVTVEVDGDLVWGFEATDRSLREDLSSTRRLRRSRYSESVGANRMVLFQLIFSKDSKVEVAGTPKVVSDQFEQGVFVWVRKKQRITNH